MKNICIKKEIVISILFSIFFVKNIYAQIETVRLTFPTLFGVGTGIKLDDNANYYINSNVFDIQASSKKWEYALQAHAVLEASKSFISIGGGNQPPIMVEQYAALIGKKKQNNNMFVKLLTGIALVNSVERGKYLGNGGVLGPLYYEPITNYTIGLPINVKIGFLTRKKKRELCCLNINANINNYKPIIGCSFNFQIDLYDKKHYTAKKKKP